MDGRLPARSSQVNGASVVGAHQLTETRETAAEKHAGGAGRATHAFGDLGMRESQATRQDDDLAIVLGQFVEGGFESSDVFAAYRGARW